jgi:hypothetical protein
LDTLSEKLWQSWLPELLNAGKKEEEKRKEKYQENTGLP